MPSRTRELRANVGWGALSVSLFRYVINKSGGLIYNRNFLSNTPRLDVSDAMRLGSIWFSLHTIASQLSPVSGPSRGLKVLHADTFDLHCMQALTGTLFFLVTEPGAGRAPAPAGAASPAPANAAEHALRLVYQAYADYVLKNPFYETEMPIRCELFDVALTALFAA